MKHNRHSDSDTDIHIHISHSRMRSPKVRDRNTNTNTNGRVSLLPLPLPVAAPLESLTSVSCPLYIIIFDCGGSSSASSYNILMLTKFCSL